MFEKMYAGQGRIDETTVCFHQNIYRNLWFSEIRYRPTDGQILKKRDAASKWSKFMQNRPHKFPRIR